LISLRIEYRNYEGKLKDLQAKDNAEPLGGTKRKRPDDLRNDQANKRLRSAVSVSGSETASVSTSTATSNSTATSTSTSTSISAPQLGPAEKRDVRHLSGEDKKRTSRLFNSLLVGTLESFKKQEEKKASQLQQRKEVEKMTEDKVSAEHQKFVEEDQKRRKDEVSKWQSKLDRVMKDIEEKEKELIKLRSVAHAQQLSNFLVTKNVLPAVYYFPCKRDEFTEKVLGTKPVVLVAKVEPVATDQPVSSDTQPEVAPKEDAKAEKLEEKKEDAVPVEEVQKSVRDDHSTYQEEDEKEKKAKKEEELAEGEPPVS